MKELVDLIKMARRVFVCGNGGSAATAEHFTNDLFSKGIKAMCLNSNTSIMTMIANDFGYQYVFSNQMNVYATPHDLLVVFSGSGNSPNIVEVLKQGICPKFAILGMGGGEAAKLADHYLIVNSNKYEVIENKHLWIAHKVKKLL